ncbi:N-acetylglucosaminyl-diphospho-decaprenol L-rhamnosyltransferase [Mycetocola sp. BIGb0189]|uniref:glycosyltransferase family 2 protein n=1 Tax=Mycetocola sp. BIGb0189 TaxID=2940604 RepID=UPI002168BCC5|nr:glycosyltransferase family 2 protein [Mycetocola sp. BIGb0189]MCS4276784.1 N-acetylglucosaminyl-diphospho-decaprenol L-rhamnosyltransferase [Mycetocola sp. BIGb0189]
MDSSATASVPQRVSTITVSYGSAEVLPGLLSSLRDAYGSELPITVADNNPARAGVRDLSEHYAARYLPIPENPGYGAAINRAAESETEPREWIFVCNPDLEVSPGCLEALLAVADSDPQIGVLGPRILQPDGEIYPSARNVPSIRAGIGHALFANIWPSNPWSANYHNRTEGSEPRDSGWLSGACLLIRRDVFTALGGFDDSYFMYFEDVDLGYRAGNADWRNVYVPAATVTHTGGHSTQDSSGEMLLVHHRSAARFLGRKYSHPLLWPLRAVLNVGLGVRGHLLAAKARRTQRH